MFAHAFLCNTAPHDGDNHIGKYFMKNTETDTHGYKAAKIQTMASTTAAGVDLGVLAPQRADKQSWW